MRSKKSHILALFLIGAAILSTPCFRPVFSVSNPFEEPQLFSVQKAENSAQKSEKLTQKANNIASYALEKTGEILSRFLGRWGILTEDTEGFFKKNLLPKAREGIEYLKEEYHYRRSIFPTEFAREKKEIQESLKDLFRFRNKNN